MILVVAATVMMVVSSDRSEQACAQAATSSRNSIRCFICIPFVTGRSSVDTTGRKGDQRS
ncbi:putative 50S ribosomal protein L31 [Burkholderia multivorans CF2]|nr:putative 50S ribosomal protein L31 [Burkholderia multivorans CF2]PRH47214.1 hypothetical protein C6V05_16465 [Burkholderia multivorans]